MLRNHTLGSPPSAVSAVAILRPRSVETYLCLVSARDLSALVRCVLHSSACSAAALALSQPRGSVHIHDVSCWPLLLRILAVAVYGLLPTLASQQMCSYSSVREDRSVAELSSAIREHTPAKMMTVDDAPATEWGVCSGGQTIDGWSISVFSVLGHWRVSSV